jgi:hypothetical protein
MATHGQSLGLAENAGSWGQSSTIDHDQSVMVRRLSGKTAMTDRSLTNGHFAKRPVNYVFATMTNRSCHVGTHLVVGVLWSM